MKTKKSSYQKLKDENLSLRQDLYKIVKGTFTEKVETEVKWKTVFDMVDVVMGSSPVSDFPIKEGKGIWDQIKSFKK